MYSATAEQISAAHCSQPTWMPEGEMPKKHRNFQAPVYGMNRFGDLFTRRQLTSLDTFAELIESAPAAPLVNIAMNRRLRSMPMQSPLIWRSALTRIR